MYLGNANDQTLNTLCGQPSTHLDNLCGGHRTVGACYKPQRRLFDERLLLWNTRAITVPHL